MGTAIVMVMAIVYPDAILAVVCTMFPVIAVGLWTLKCPHCGHRLVRNGASDIEWRYTSKWWTEPSRCKRCGNEL